MAIRDEQIEFVLDLFESLRHVTVRKMFGGIGIYYDGIIFAIMTDEGEISLKGVREMAARFESEGWQRWRYTSSKGKSVSMPYWTMPEALLDDPQEACAWALSAIDVLQEAPNRYT